MSGLSAKSKRAVGLAALLSTLACPAFAQGTPRSMSECERLKNDLAYNQCLAMFGPEAKMIAGGDGGGSKAAFASPPPAPTSGVAGIPAVEEPQFEEPVRRGGRRSRSTGRQSASFEVSGAEAAPARRSYRRWSRRR